MSKRSLPPKINFSFKKKTDLSDGKSSKKAFWSSLLMTFLATTISIVLTFGTAKLLDHRERVKDRKLSALMVMSNIETFANKLEIFANDMERRDTIGAWILSKPAEYFDSIPEVELQRPVNRLVALNLLSHDKTAESIFSDNIDTWKNMGNFQFIDNVGQCFSMMNEIERYWNDWVFEVEEDSKEVVAHPDQFKGENMYSKQIGYSALRSKIARIHRWSGWLRYAAATIRYSNEKNMALIGISKKELDEFTELRNKDIAISSQKPNANDYYPTDLDVNNLPTIKSMTDRLDSIAYKP